MRQKLVFFDIDGTLWDERQRIPESTKEAVAALQKNGHKAVICSGRTRGFIRDPELLAMNFDGIVAGCGTMIEYGKDGVIFHHLIDDETALSVVELIYRCGFGAILEGPKCLYLDAEDFVDLPDVGYVAAVAKAMGRDAKSIKGSWGKWEMNKFSVSINHETKKAFFEALDDKFDFIFHNEQVAEIVPKGFDKAKGMARLCEYAGIDPADTFAFGDSVNDIGMLTFAGTGVAMGNSHPDAAAAADYVTAPLWEDGVAKALKHFDLIG